MTDDDSSERQVTAAAGAQCGQSGPDAKELREAAREDAKEERDLARAKLELLFETVTETRRFEIGLFWQRALFFWGFIASAFVGYATLSRYGSRRLALVVACFGFVCSVAWSLANRGSKYWQENWEEKAKRIELEVLNEPVFGHQEPASLSGGWWLRPRRFSVSRLATALADFTGAVWLVLMVGTALAIAPHEAPLPSWVRELYPIFSTWGWFAAPFGTLLFAGYMMWRCRTAPNEQSDVTPPLKDEEVKPPPRRRGLGSVNGS
jgi:hypothetical protein